MFSRPSVPIPGIQLKADKSEVGGISFLGLLGWFSSAKNDYTTHISLPGESRGRWFSLLADFVARRSISSHELETLIGRMFFIASPAFWEIREDSS